MRLTAPISLALLGASSTLAFPLQARTAPTNQTKLPQAVIATAGGNVPNAAPPTTVSPAALNAFQVALFLENLESAFFQAGVQNLTAWGTAGFPNNTLDVVARVAAQEQIHVATFANLLTHFDTPAPPPCTYTFPVATTADFLALAQVITSVGIGAVIDIAASVAATDPSLLQSIASAVTVEARHDAFFRGLVLGGKAGVGQGVPNPTPFDTRVSPVWALNLARPFVVPGSCALAPDVPILPSLTVVSAAAGAAGANGTVTFATGAGVAATAGMFVAWVNQANLPVYTPVTLAGAGRVTTSIPAGMGGLAFAALTGQDVAADVAALTAATVAGPAPVQIS